MSLCRNLDEDMENEWEDNKRDKKEEHHDCDSESARALKRILSLLDDLNNEDLRLLDDIIDRLLCSRKRV